MSYSQNNVYCKGCKFIKTPEYGDSICKKYYVNNDNNYYNKQKIYCDCKAINKNNDCVHYKASFFRQVYLILRKIILNKPIWDN